MRHIDASAVIDLWELYPINQFPAVWDWVCSEFEAGDLAICDVALAEVGHRVPDCKNYLDSRAFSALPMSATALSDAVAIKAALGIVGDAYGTGVDENDILIIAMARIAGAELVTDEALQPSLPRDLKKYKIPAVCLLPSVSVASIRLGDYIRQSARVFG